MRIVVACQGLGVSPLYDISDAYTFYTIERGVITSCQSLPFTRATDESRVSMLLSLDVNVLICGAINADAAAEYCHAGIEVIAGCNGTAREVVDAWLSKTLSGAEELCSL